MNFYETLNLPPKATVKDIEQAYRQLARKVHPDFHSDKADASEDHMKMLNLIRYTLTDPERRSRYDAELLKSGQTSLWKMRLSSRWSVAWSHKQWAMIMMAGILLGMTLGGSLWFHRRLSARPAPLPLNQPLTSVPSTLSAPVPGASPMVTTNLQHPPATPSKPSPHVVQRGSSLKEVLEMMGNPDRVEEDPSHDLRVLYYGKLRLIFQSGKLVQGLTQP